MDDKRGLSIKETLDEAREERKNKEKRRKGVKTAFIVMGALIASLAIALFAIESLNANKAKSAATTEEIVEAGEETHKATADTGTEETEKTVEVQASENTVEEKKSSLTVPDEIKEDQNIVTLTAVGDNLIHEAIYNQAAERAGGDGYDFKRCYEEIAPFIKQHDVNVINLETIMTDDIGPSSYPQFATPTQSAKDLYDLGWNVFSVASNHTYDYSDEGVASTMNFWRSMPDDCIYTGLWTDFGYIPIIEAKGHKIAVMTFIYGCTFGTSGRYGTAIFFSMTDVIKNMIAKAREEADCVIVYCHWGNEYEHEIDENQRYTAQLMADWGADLILGAHPHVVQDCEIINTWDGREVFCAYSLGNFLSGQRETDTLIEGMLECKIVFGEENGVEGKCEIRDPKIIPMVNVYGKDLEDIHTVFLENYTPELAKEHGVKEFDQEFSYDIITDVMKENISEEYLSMPS